MRRPFLCAFLGALSAIIVMLAACSPPIQADQARAVVERYYHHLQNKEYAQAVAMFDDRRLTQKPPETWIGEISARHAELGDLQQFSLLRFEVNTQYRGRLYIFDYATTYGKQSASETVTLFEDHDGQTIKIVAHEISL